MCGRFVSTATPAEVAEYFGAEPQGNLAPPEPNYNTAPTDDIYVVYESGETRTLDAFHWGLVPFWAKDPSIGNRMINARAEGLATQNAYRHAFRKRRCLIPADGFYEWKKVPGQKTKQPYFISRADGEPVAFAGLWEVWRGGPTDDTDAREDGERLRQHEPTLRSCTIVTTDANALVEPLHDRMPVVLPPSAWDQWLDPTNDDLDALGQLLVPAPSELLTLRPVSTDVNDVRNAGAHLIDEVDPTGSPPATHQARQGTLL